ncbi:MAG TPA: metal-dependent hydrolase [Kineosporiaceae bacterium]|nr:metal-dependent hydrolase [Kineosporiaceae bacterium]
MPSDRPPVPALVVRTTSWLADRPVVGAALCVAGALLVGLLDAALSGREPLLVTAVLDEPAHLLTAGLLAAVLPGRARAVVPWALAGAVLIDLDHLPFYLWGALSTEGAGRPVTHSLATAAALAAAAAVVASRHLRTALSGFALGVGLHLVRDLATGPGVPLWWPVEDAGVLVPHAWYALVLGVAAAVAGGRQLSHSRARSRPSSRSVQ